MAEIKITEIKPNSHAYKEQQAAEKEVVTKDHLKPVVAKANIVSTKKSLGTKMKETFFGADIKDAKSYLIKEVVIPGAKNAILDFMSMLFFNKPFYGGGRSSYYHGYSSGYNSGGYYNYGRNYQSNYGSRPSDPPQQKQTGYVSNDKVDYRSIVVNDRRDAESICSALWERIDMYQAASVADLLDLIDVSAKFTDNNWGWTNKQEIGVKRVPGGFLIDVEEAKPID